VRRREIVVIGTVLLIVKYGLDLAVSQLFKRELNALMYLSPRVSPLLTAHDPRYLGALDLVALPFVWIGVSLSVRRLRDAGLSPSRGTGRIADQPRRLAG
jgi:hypothetical protein